MDLDVDNKLADEEGAVIRQATLNDDAAGTQQQQDGDTDEKACDVSRDIMVLFNISLHTYSVCIYLKY